MKRVHVMVLGGAAVLAAAAVYSGAGIPFAQAAEKTKTAEPAEAPDTDPGRMKVRAEMKAAAVTDPGKNPQMLNSAGYWALYQADSPKQAVNYFRWNITLFPQPDYAAQLEDSLAEGLLQAGDAEGAIEHYSKAAALDPSNTNAASIVGRLKADPRSLPDVQRLQRFKGIIDMARASSVDMNLLAGAVNGLQSVAPQDPSLPGAVSVLFGNADENLDTPTRLALWRSYLNNPNEQVRKVAERRRTVMEGYEKPIELTFTAVDGRKVDLKKLRGKVVMLDFWATWCGPCMAEMPNVKKAYAAYHDKGFEIVGVSCDYAPNRAGPSRPAKGAKTAPQLVKFLEKNKMPWPQFYDGRKDEAGNALAVRFGVNGIPSGFLLDKDGKIASTSVRGEQLEKEIERLLAAS